MTAARAFVVVSLAMSLAAHAHMGPHPEAGVGFDQHIGARVPIGARFVDARGRSTTIREAIAGKPALLVLGYAHCHELCATTVPGVAEALDRAGLTPGRQYRALFVSIDAREDPVALSEALARVPDADRVGWRFLGRNDEAVRDLAQAVGFRYRYETDRDAFAHPAGFVVLTPDGTVSRYFFGVRFEPADVRHALEAASRGATGSLTDRLLLLCYHFDPLTGRYSAAIVGLLRAIGIACVLAMALALWRSRKRGAAT
jgi:protein SCO1/2